MMRYQSWKPGWLVDGDVYQVNCWCFSRLPASPRRLATWIS